MTQKTRDWFWNFRAIALQTAIMSAALQVLLLLVLLAAGINSFKKVQHHNRGYPATTARAPHRQSHYGHTTPKPKKPHHHGHHKDHHPTHPPREVNCQVGGRVIRSGYTFHDGCSMCKCSNGVLACAGKKLEPGCIYYQGEVNFAKFRNSLAAFGTDYNSTQTPPPPPASCPDNPQLGLNRLNGEEFLSAADGCSLCLCEAGTVQCEHRDRCHG